jgi:hypothetical protein
MHNRYHTGRLRPEQVRSWAERYAWLHGSAARLLKAKRDLPARISLDGTPWLQRLVEHGYAVALVDARGTGASFGRRTGPFSPEEALDARDVSRWLASQPWSSGAVGMFGRSYMGTAQFFAAIADPAEPPVLRATFPEMAPFDLYDFVYPGGVFRHAFGRQWVDDLVLRDRHDPLAPLEVDPDGALLAAARAEHEGNLDTYGAFAALPYRDSRGLHTGEQPYLTRSPSALAASGRRPTVPVYLLAGWQDAFVRDAFLWYQAAAGPRRLVIGPWAHTGSVGFDMFEEHAWWFDRWLRGAGAEPGEDMPPIHYYRMGAALGERWRSTDVWPLREAVPTAFHLRRGRAGTCRSVNDGRLAVQPPARDEGADAYRIDYRTTTGRATRWTNASGGPFDYPDLSRNDERGLTYTTDPLPADTEVTGHPLLHLWISSSSAAPDADVFAYLEEVTEQGRSLYVTEGTLRASHRALSTPPADRLDLGLPYHRSYEADVAPLPDHPVELVLDLLPISRVFPAGRRIRLTLTCADRDNALTPVLAGPPTLHVHRDAAHPSRLVLPVVAR